MLQPSDNQYRMHVFADLQPYICTSSDCPDLLKTFSERKTWAEHEFLMHRFETVYNCRDCSKSFTTEPDFLQHQAKDHKMDSLKHAQALALATAARKTVLFSITDQECPLCHEGKWESQRKFVAHVCRHMEEIALSALPQDIGSSSDISDSSSSGLENEIHSNQAKPHVKKYFTVDEMKDHLSESHRAEHSDDDGHVNTTGKCSLCEKIFPAVESYFDHLNECSAAFRREQELVIQEELEDNSSDGGG